MLFRKNTLFKACLVVVTTIILGICSNAQIYNHNDGNGNINQTGTIDEPTFKDNNGGITGTTSSDADWGDDDPGGPGGGGGGVADVPFDNGVIVLIVFGVVGGYILSRKRLI